MTLEIRDILTLIVIVVSIGSTLLVNRNSRNATQVNAQSLDLSRIRDLRTEVSEAKADLAATRTELNACQQQAAELHRRLLVSNREAGEAWTELAELKRLAHRPGMTIPLLLEYIGPLANSTRPPPDGE